MSRFLVATAVALIVGLPLAHGKEARSAPMPISLTVGRTIRLQLSTKAPLRSVTVDRSGIVKVSPVFNDPTSIFLTGIAPGKARVTLVGEDGKKMVLAIGR